MASSNQVRQQLLADYGECVCSPDMCFDDPNGDGADVSAEAHAEIAEDVSRERTEDARSRYEENPQ